MEKFLKQLHNIKTGKILHYIVRNEPNLKKPPKYVEAINALNPFVKPGYNFVSVSINDNNIEEFKTLAEKGLIEAFFYL